VKRTAVKRGRKPKVPWGELVLMAYCRKLERACTLNAAAEWVGEQRGVSARTVINAVKRSHTEGLLTPRPVRLEGRQEVAPRVLARMVYHWQEMEQCSKTVAVAQIARIFNMVDKTVQRAVAEYEQTLAE